MPENIFFLWNVDVLVEAFDRPIKAMLMQYGGSCPLVAASGLAGYGSGESIGVRRWGSSLCGGDLKTAAAPGCGNGTAGWDCCAYAGECSGATTVG